jgi:hypothetical protein
MFPVLQIKAKTHRIDPHNFQRGLQSPSDRANWSHGCNHAFRDTLAGEHGYDRSGYRCGEIPAGRATAWADPTQMEPWSAACGARASEIAAGSTTDLHPRLGAPGPSGPSGPLSPEEPESRSALPRCCDHAASWGRPRSVINTQHRRVRRRLAHPRRRCRLFAEVANDPVKLVDQAEGSGAKLRSVRNKAIE